MKAVFSLILFVLSFHASAIVYVGGSYGYGNFSSDPVEEYKNTLKGFNYGGFLGIGKDFVGLEGFYHRLNSIGEIRHDGGTYDMTSNATAIGAALRFSFQFFFVRMGVASYKLDQSLDIDNQTTRAAAEEIYEIHDGETKSGVLFGAGLHTKLGSRFRGFVDFSRYQITGIGYYHTYSAGISFLIPEKFFSAGRH